MGATGKAAVFLGPGKGYEIQEFEVPTPEPGGIVIKVTYGGICGSDLHIWRGDSPMFAMMAGNVAGHEMTGRVHSLGAGVTTDSLGRPLKEVTASRTRTSTPATAATTATRASSRRVRTS
jgi:D-arabinose 1-dehydrogenase-like Zn-dependent alcohol dehydrogenase